MPLPPKKSDQELYDLCREIQQRDGSVTANRLRDAAGGGGFGSSWVSGGWIRCQATSAPTKAPRRAFPLLRVLWTN
jgi:hypothetical protein